MSFQQNKKLSDVENYNKIMNQSVHSSNTKGTENSQHKKMRLRSNTIFAFQDDHIYSNVYPDEGESDLHSHSNYFTNNDTLLIHGNNNLNNSNFFSTACDKSQVWFNLNTTTQREENENELDNSIGSIAEEMEKNFRFLNDVDDDLNDAKLSLNEDVSIISEKSSNMNMTTPVNNKFRRMIESEDMRNMHTNLNTQQSFSSFLNSNCSSSLMYPHSFKGNMKLIGTNNPQPLPNHNSSSSMSVISSSNNPNEFLHANSVDFNLNIPNIQSPFRGGYNSMLSTAQSHKNLTNLTNINFSNYNGNPNQPSQLDLEHFQSQNFISSTPKNFMNPYAYSFCLDNTLNMNMYKNYVQESNNRSNIINTNPNNTIKNFVPPVAPRFNLNEDKSVLDNLMVLIKDQNGCRMIQKKLEEKKEEFLKSFFEKIKSNICEIICDQFGNYVIQKFVECCNDKNIIKNLMVFIKPKIYHISINCYGTRGFQRIIDFLSEESDYEIMKDYLTNNVFNLIKDVNGSHVIQKVLQVYPKERNNFILLEIIDNIIEISKLKQGGCIFQKALERATKDDQTILLERIVLNVEQLINDEHANFIVQYTVNLKIEKYNKKIFDFVKSNLIYLSKQKYSSNVIDKCILYEDSCLQGELIDKLIELKCIGELIMDQYGNYVVQKALQVSNGIKFLEIIEHIKKILKSLKQTNYGKKIYDNLMSNYSEYLVSNVNKQKNSKKPSTMSNKKPTIILKKDTKVVTSSNLTNGK